MELQLHQSQNTVSVADSVFGAAYNEPLIHQVITAYQAAARAGTKAQKTKGEVSGGGRKPWRQKGTGRARAGSIRSPIWRGGGRAFAAKPRSFRQKVNRKMYRGALRCLLSELARQSLLLVSEDFVVDSPKTALLLKKLHAAGVQDVLIVTDGVGKDLYLASRNVSHVTVCDTEALNPLSLLTHERVLMTAPAIKKVEAWLS